MTSTHGDDSNQQYGNHTPSKMNLEIYHQCPGIELVSPVYACNSAKCRTSPDQIVCFGSMMQACFDIDSPQTWPTGILMYELKNTKPFNNDDAISSKDEATCTQLFIIWKVKNFEKFCVNLRVIEHDKGCVWDRINLMELTYWCNVFNVQHGPIEETWLMHDHTALMISTNAAREEGCYKLEITVSEGSIKDDTWRPRYISSSE
jgi:hypothetical protein